MKDIEKIKIELRKIIDLFNLKEIELRMEVISVMEILKNIRDKIGQKHFASKKYWIEFGSEISDLPKAGTIENGTENPGIEIFTKEFNVIKMKEFMKNAPTILEIVKKRLEEDLNFISK